MEWIEIKEKINTNFVNYMIEFPVNFSTKYKCTGK